MNHDIQAPYRPAPIVPKDAKEYNVICQFCIVGCGYKAYTWDINKQGGPAPDKTNSASIFPSSKARDGSWYAPSMYNIVKQDGEDVHLVIKPDHDCVVNSGLASIRGARMAERILFRSRSTRAAAADRADGMALRPNAADELGRRSRSGRARDAA